MAMLRIRKCNVASKLFFRRNYVFMCERKGDDYARPPRTTSMIMRKVIALVRQTTSDNR